MVASKPILLVAVPQLGDPNFFHSVVLIFQHDAEGAMGLAINRPTSLNLGEFARSQEMDCRENLAMKPVYQGGPVELERGWLLHADSSVAERHELLPNLFLSAGNETLRTLLREGKAQFRFLLGYAGWGPGQLEDEMKEGAWITVDAQASYVLETPASQTWNRVLQDLGIDPATLALGRGLH